MKPSSLIFVRHALLTLVTVILTIPARAQTNPTHPFAGSTSLSAEVRRRLVTLPYYSVFDNLGYKLEGKRVTLSGQVVKAALKDGAEKAVKNIEGIEAVDNKIQVLPLSADDDHTRQLEYAAIYSFPSLYIYAVRAVPPIHIIVDHGHVTLVGIVANEANRDAADVRANMVPGVFSVTNNLRLETKGDRE
jgi:hyperosmotically inducible periplasmic protein